MPRIRKAVFPVAGLGTRFLPATKSIPKELLPVVDKPVVQYAVDEARAAGIKQFIFVSARGKTAIENYFDRAPELEEALAKRGKTEALDDLQGARADSGDIVFLRQHEPLGLGHAVWCARRIVGDEPFAVLLPDELVLGERSCLAELIEARNRLGRCHLIAVQDVPHEHTRRYGILDPGGERDVQIIRAKNIVEKPEPAEAPSTIAAIGRYVLDPAVFAHLERGATGVGGEVQLTDAVAASMGLAPLYGMRFRGVRYDCGDKLGFLKANIAFALARPELADGLRAFIGEIAPPESC